MTPALALPADLTELDQWCLWNYETRSGKRTKIPIQPTGKPASSTDPKTWRSYAEVCACEGFAGIGFVFTADDPYVGIDLDNCLEASGAVKAWAVDLVTAFHDTYAEISPSGNGIKIFTKGRLPGRGKRKNFEGYSIEIYDQGRFFTVTGNVFAGAPLQIEEHQADILRLYSSLDDASKGSAQVAHGQPITQGNRHKTLVSMAGAMRRRGMSPAAIDAALWAENQARCVPPYDHPHIAQIAESSEKWPVPAQYVGEAGQALQPDTDPAIESQPSAVEQLTEPDLYPTEFIDAFRLCNPAGRREIVRQLRAKFGRQFHSTVLDQIVNEAALAEKRAEAGSGDSSWASELLTTEKGKALAVVANALVALRSPEWAGVLNFNLSSMDVVAKCPPPWPEARPVPFIWSDDDDTHTAAWLQRQGIMLPPKATAEAVQAISKEHSFHPVRDYLTSELPEWDQVERIDFWLETFLGVGVPSDVSTEEAAEFLAYIRDVAAKFLVGAVARAMQPGCKHDTMLIIEGIQGAKKSTALATLFEPWFTDDMPDLHTKDASMSTRGVWLIEFGELDNISKAEVDRIKAFLSRRQDHFRPPYGRRMIWIDRESVFAGTCNKNTYLRDETGGRRFWPIASEGTIDICGLKAARPQLWAEALARYSVPNPVWWINNAEILRESQRQQESRYEQDPWQEIIEPWLESPTQRFLTGTQPIEPFTSSRESTTLLEVGLHAIGKRAGDFTQADKNRVAQCLRTLKWVRRKAGTREKREYRYMRAVAAD